jgi:hypothetical protein
MLSRLRRGLPRTPLTSANELPHTMIGGLSGAGGLTAAHGLPTPHAVARMMLWHQHAFQHCCMAFTGVPIVREPREHDPGDHR